MLLLPALKAVGGLPLGVSGPLLGEGLHHLLSRRDMQVPARKLSVRETLKVPKVTVSPRLQGPGSRAPSSLCLWVSLCCGALDIRLGGPGRRSKAPTCHLLNSWCWHFTFAICA